MKFTRNLKSTRVLYNKEFFPCNDFLALLTRKVTFVDDVRVLTSWILKQRLKVRNKKKKSLEVSPLHNRHSPNAEFSVHLVFDFKWPNVVNAINIAWSFANFSAHRDSKCCCFDFSLYHIVDQNFWVKQNLLDVYNPSLIVWNSQIMSSLQVCFPLGFQTWDKMQKQPLEVLCEKRCSYTIVCGVFLSYIFK